MRKLILINSEIAFAPVSKKNLRANNLTFYSVQNTLDCASPTGRQDCVPTRLKAPDQPCCEKDEYFCHSKNQTQIHSRQNNGPNVITSTSRKGTIWSPNRCYGLAIACEPPIWDKISDCRSIYDIFVSIP